MTRKWLNGYAAMYEKPDPKSRKVRDLLERSLVVARDEVVYWGEHPFALVSYEDAKPWMGWVYAGLLEDYEEQLPKDCVDLGEQTPAAHDAEQYVIYNGAKQVNLCGQICAAYAAGLPLGEMLELWRTVKPALWERVFRRRGYVAGGTGVPDLLSMLEAAGMGGFSLAEAMRDPYLRRSRYSPAWLQRLTESGQVIAGVTIHKYSGRLTAGGVLHWVVVERVVPERCGYGGVLVYNPFPNRVEGYSWSEFVTAAKVPMGVYVPKETL